MTQPVWWIKHKAACLWPSPYDDRYCSHMENYSKRCDPSGCPTMVEDLRKKARKFNKEPKFFVVWVKAVVGKRTTTTTRDEFPATTDLEEMLDEITSIGSKNSTFALKSIEIEPKF